MGATITRGPESAYRTAQLLYGEHPPAQLLTQIGFQNVRITGKGKDVRLTFTPQKLTDKGDGRLTKTKAFPLPRKTKG
jgi:hypothetical protein